MMIFLFYYPLHVIYNGMGLQMTKVYTGNFPRAHLENPLPFLVPVEFHNPEASEQ
jgi:hypothetical protein